MTCVRTLKEWQHELAGRGPNSLTGVIIKIIATPAGEAVGYLVHASYLWKNSQGTGLGCWGYELKAGVS